MKCSTLTRLSLCIVVLGISAGAQVNQPDVYGNLRFRQIGPFRGGRVVAVAGVPSQPNVYYFGGTGGGLWKTLDGGIRWDPITDGQIKTGSVGAIAVADSDANVIYLGMGEGCIRGNASHGDGVYKSTDAGRTWKHVGLADTRQIGQIRIHPRNPDIAYVAALGHMSGPNDERGVFKTTDGGKTWRRVLFRSNKAGAIDLDMDHNNPDVLYATFWETIRTPWVLESGGPGSGIFKSTDAGETWREISRNPGLPRGVLGRIGVAVSPANSDRVWAIVEADDGGVFRSDNAGRTWTRLNTERDLLQRAWYYSHIYADPKNENVMYALNTGMYRSTDGGRTFTAIATPHGDNHDLWIAPEDPSRMVEGNDSGANVSYNGGRSWSTINNQATAQFYRVALDNDFPYHIYGAQQDNSTVAIVSRSNAGGITERDWHEVGGGESGWIAPDPNNSDIVYAGSYDGLLTRYNHKTGATRNISPWPDNPMGYAAEGLKYRFQWSYPILFSPHDPKTLYVAANVLFKTTNEGQSWEVISPDLTRNDKSKQGSSGGPITKDNTSIEYYCTIYTVDESPVQKGLIWTGSDDGLVYLTRDGGKNWAKVTPPDMPEFIRINAIAASPFDAAVAYVAATNYELDDFRPYLYKTGDYGKTWKKIVNGIPDNDWTRVVREDPHKRGLLVAGTETSLYISYDDGDNWKRFSLNIPAVPITDVAFHKRDDDLVVATQGRSFYVLDDMALARQVNEGIRSEETHLFQPKDAYRIGAGGFGPGARAPIALGENPPAGAVVYYWLKDRPKGDVTLEFLDASGKLVAGFSSKAPPSEGAPAAEEARPLTVVSRASANPGMNRFAWDLRYPDATIFPNLILWAGGVRGPMVVPGKYQVRLTVDGKTQTQSFAVNKDPRTPTTPEDFQKQLTFALQVRDKLSQTNEGVIRIREARRQLEPYTKSDNKAVAEAAGNLNKRLTAVEEELYQTKNRAHEDPLNFPIKLNNKIASLLNTVLATDVSPTAQSQAVFEEVAAKVDGQLRSLDKLLTEDLAAFNKLVREQNVPAVVVKGKGAGGE